MDDFEQELRDSSYIRETPEEVFDYYQSKYGMNWKGALADDLAPLLGIKRSSVMRRFQGARAGVISEAHAEQYRQLGETIPPIPPENGYRVYGTVCIAYSDECVERDVDEAVQGNAAQDLADTLNIQIIVNLYNEDPYNTAHPVAGLCGGASEDCVTDLHVEPL